MSSTEPPEPNPPEPTPAAPRSAPDGTAAGPTPSVTGPAGAQQRTEPVGSSAGTAGHPSDPAAQGTVPGGAGAVAVRSGSAGFAPAADGSSRPGGRRRWPWVLGGVAVVIVALLVGSAVTLGVLHHARGHERFAAGGPGVEGRAWGTGGLLREGHGGPFGGHRGGAWGKGRQPGSSMLLGSITSVNGANLVLTPDAGAAPVTVTTTDQTKVAGGQLRALSDLKAGDRVAVRVAPDHSASGIMLVPATVRGTVTALSGTSATIMQPDGLPQAVDTSGLPTQPRVGDRVAVTGTASGSTIKARNLRELPKTG